MRHKVVRHQAHGSADRRNADAMDRSNLRPRGFGATEGLKRSERWERRDAVTNDGEWL